MDEQKGKSRKERPFGKSGRFCKFMELAVCHCARISLCLSVYDRTLLVTG